MNQTQNCCIHGAMIQTCGFNWVSLVSFSFLWVIVVANSELYFKQVIAFSEKGGRFAFL